MPIHSSRSPPPLTPLASAFRFTLPSTSIDWPAISNLDARQVIKDTDLDALENVLDSLVHGNLREDIREGTVDIPQEAPCRLFEASQLALQYLLYVQERLATELRSLKVRLILR